MRGNPLDASATEMTEREEERGREMKNENRNGASITHDNER